MTELNILIEMNRLCQAACEACSFSPIVVQDMDQLYELWLLSQKPGWSEENSNGVVRENGRQIVMPTDFAEEVVRSRVLCMGLWGPLYWAAQRFPYLSVSQHAHGFAGGLPTSVCVCVRTWGSKN